MSHLRRLSILTLGLAPWVAVHAQNAAPSDPKACIGIETDSQRLACYDRAMGRTHLPETAPVESARNRVPITNVPEAGDLVFGNEKRNWQQAGTARVAAASDDTPAPAVSLLDSRWELAPDTKLGTYNIRGYKPVYLLPVFMTSNVNNLPATPAPGHVVSRSLGYDKIEAKFQLSLKTKIWQGVFGDVGDLWVAYTQSSRWQIYNKKDSRPFRETDYQPEAMLVFNTNYHVLGWDGRLLGIGVNHQSNGRADPLSRSWNRVIADIGFERNGWTLMLRPWWRIPEPSSIDDNPDIEDYMGRGDLTLVHETHGNEFSLMLRHSLRGGDRSHGAAKFTWAFPIHDKLRGYFEIFHGYGESLIDYNHRATYAGIGVSLLDWY